MEFWGGQDTGWTLIAVYADDDVDDEPFLLEMTCELIGSTPQGDGVKVVQRE